MRTSAYWNAWKWPRHDRYRTVNLKNSIVWIKYIADDTLRTSSPQILLQSAGRDIATVDRYQVIVSVDAAELSTVDTTVTAVATGSDISIPSKRPSVNGAGPIARETARRIACDCSLSVNTTTYGEPIDIGRKFKNMAQRHGACHQRA